MDTALDQLFYQSQKVRFFYWDQLSRGRTTIYLIGIIGILTFITGLSNLSQDILPLDGPLPAVLPISATFVQVWGVLVAFVVVGLTFGLRWRKRIAWYGLLAVLPTIAILPLVTLQVQDVLAAVLVLVALPLLVHNRELFDQPVDLSPLQIASMASIIGVLAYATVGSYMMRDRYVGIETWTDALYYVIVTIATVGYGDATPVTQETKLFTLSFILIGTGAFTVAIGSLLIPAIEKRMAAAVGHMKPSELALLEDHILILGTGELTRPIIDELGDEGDVVVITEDTDSASQLDDLAVSVVSADPIQKESLIDANIGAARAVVVATEDDAMDVMAILTVRQVNPDIYIVAAASDQHHIDKLQDVGADEVVSPIVLGGRLIGRSVLDGTRPTITFGETADEAEE